MRKLSQIVVMALVLAGFGAGFSGLAMALEHGHWHNHSSNFRVKKMDTGTRINKDAVKQLQLYQPGNGGRNSATPIQLPGPR